MHNFQCKFTKICHENQIIRNLYTLESPFQILQVRVRTYQKMNTFLFIKILEEKIQTKPTEP